MLNYTSAAEASVEKLEPTFSVDIHKLLEESPFRWYITYAYRSLEEQLTLYNAYIKTGKNKAAPPGKSAHNFGLAVDVVLDNSDEPGLQPSWNTKLAGWVWLFVKLKLHPRLKSGVTFGDGGHIEKYQWERYKNWNVQS